ncbi:MAG: helix-turn-helix domain-containing protein [Trebonia sp.]
MLLTVDQVADQLGTTPRHIRELRARRELPAVMVGRLVRFDPADIAAYVAAHRSPALRGPLANGTQR